MPRTSRASKPDQNTGANFLLEIEHGLNGLNETFHVEWRWQGTIRPPINEPPINEEGRAVTRDLP